MADESDFIFSGMNLHQGAPEELHHLARQLRELIAPDGSFFSHDVFRPDGQPYCRRPDVSPADPSESLRLVPAERIAAGGALSASFPVDREAGEPGWRRDYLERMRRTLLARGGGARVTATTLEHMQERDFRVSAQELRDIFSSAGFHISTRRFVGTGEPLEPYVACCMARLHHGLRRFPPGAGA